MTTTPSGQKSLPPVMAEDLLRRWPDLKPPERGDLLRSIVDQGYSRRAIASALNCYESTIRRTLKLARLPAPIPRAVEAGQSSKRVVHALRRGTPAPSVNRWELEHSQQRVIEHCLEQVRPWLLSELPWPGYRQQFLDEAERRVWFAPETGAPQQDPSSPVFDLRHYCPPQERPTSGPELLEYLLLWFIRWSTTCLPCRTERDQLMVKLRATIAPGQLPSALSASSS